MIKATLGIALYGNSQRLDELFDTFDKIDRSGGWPLELVGLAGKSVVVIQQRRGSTRGY
jgi:hypothetical protein